MKRTNIIRAVVTSALIATSSMLFADVASAQSHNDHHNGSNRGNGQRNQPHAMNNGDHNRGGSAQRFNGNRQHYSGNGQRFAGNEHRDNGDRLRGNRNDFRRDDHRGRDVVVINRGRPNYGYSGYRRPYYYGPGLSLGIGFGYGFDTYFDPYYDNFGLYPGECRWDYRMDYWTGRPAEVALQVCADRYGRVYVVGGTQRWVRWR